MGEAISYKKNTLPEGWTETTLKEVCYKIVDGSHNPPRESSSGKFPMISAKDVFNNKIIFDNPRWLDKESFDAEDKRTNINEGDVLLTIVATIGRSAVVQNSIPNFTLQRSVAVLKTMHNSKYVSYALQAPLFQRQLKDNAKGTAQKGVYLKTLSQLTIPLPTTDVQQKIVSKIEELFSELDKGIEELKAAQQQLKVYRQAVLKWAFENDLENRSEKLLSEVSDKIQIGPFGTQLHKEDYIEGGIPLINPMHIKDGQIVADSSYSIKEEKRNSLPNYILQKSDIIMGRRGEMGRCGLVTDKEQGWFCGTGSLYVRLDRKAADPKFIYHLLKSQPIKKYLEENAGGTTMANLNLKIVNNIPFHLPALEEQQQIVHEIESRLSVCDKIEETITDSIKQAEALRQSILKKAFEGSLL